MQDVLEMVCKRRKMENPNQYALVFENILIPLDRTVASLQGKDNLLLVRKSMLVELGIDTGTRSTRTTDPNGTSQQISGVHMFLRTLQLQSSSVTRMFRTCLVK
jgi:hypothetical protein